MSTPFKRKDQEMKFTWVAVGTEVFCMAAGWGVIKRFETSGDYPVVVEFPSKTGSGTFCNQYTPSGRKWLTDELPILYFGRPEVTAPKAPVFRPKLEGKNILLSTKDGGSPVAAGMVQEETIDGVRIGGKLYSKTGMVVNEIGKQL